MESKLYYGRFIIFIIFISLIVFFVISCGYDAGGIYRARGDYTGAALADAYYKEYRTGIIILSIIFAIIGGIIAYKKDRSVIGWVLLCGLFWVIPLIVICVLSSLNRSNNNNPKTNIEISEETTKKCPFCAEEIKKEAIVCRFCGRDLPLEVSKIDETREPVVKKNMTTKINLYEKQSLNSKIILTLFEGEKISLIEKGGKIPFVNDQWVKIVTENGTTGWCYLSSFEK